MSAVTVGMPDAPGPTRRWRLGPVCDGQGPPLRRCLACQPSVSVNRPIYRPAWTCASHSAADRVASGQWRRPPVTRSGRAALPARCPGARSRSPRGPARGPGGRRRRACWPPTAITDVPGGGFSDSTQSARKRSESSWLRKMSRPYGLAARRRALFGVARKPADPDADHREAVDAGVHVAGRLGPDLGQRVVVDRAGPSSTLTGRSRNLWPVVTWTVLARTRRLTPELRGRLADVVQPDDVRPEQHVDEVGGVRVGAKVDDRVHAIDGPSDGVAVGQVAST